MWKGVRQKVNESLPKSEFARALGLLLGGSIAGQMIGLAISPIITRLYTPSDFGVMGFYLSLLMICTASSMLRYEAAIPVADADEEAISLVALCIILALMSSVSVGLLLLMAGKFALRFSELRTIWPYRYWLVIGIFSTGCYAGLSFWSVRVRDFGLLSRTKITQNLGLATTQVGLGVLHLGALGLILGQVVGQSAGISSILNKLFQTNGSAVTALRYLSLKKVAVRYRRFPAMSMPASFMEASASNLPLVFMAVMFGSSVAGWMTLVQKVLFLPMSMLSRNIGQVYFGELADMKRNSPQLMRRGFVSRTKRLAKLSFIVSVPIAALAPLVIPALFGPAWKNSTVCLELLMPMMVLSFISSPFGSTLDVLERQDLHLLRDTVRLILTLVSLGLAYWLKLDWKSSLALISFVGCLGAGIYMWISWMGIQAYKIPPELRP
jgi:O-antigen/teichoic acid export membrane protein